MSKTPMQELLIDLDVIIRGNLPFNMEGLREMIRSEFLPKEKQAIIEAYRTVPRQISGEEYYKTKYT